MTLRPAELLLVAAETAQRLRGRPLQKVVQPDERTLLLGFAGGWLHVSLDREHGRVHLLDGKPAGTGEAASAFCMLLRKELIGLRLEAVDVVAGERAVALRLGRLEQPDARRGLLVFLYGAGAHAVLVDAEERSLGVLGGARVPLGEAVRLPLPRLDDRPSRFAAEGISAAVAAHYSSALASSSFETQRHAALAAGRREVAKLRRLADALARDLARIEVASTGRRHADLLFAHLADVPRGAAEVTLPNDFSDGEPITITLDPARSAKENAARLYHEHQRLRRGRQTVETRLARTRAELGNIELHLAEVTAAPPEALAALTLRAPAVAQSGSPNSAAASTGRRGERSPPARRLPYRVFLSTRGAEIFVGKGADRNDELTFRVARGNDLWMHTRDVPGAHVVVPLDGRAIDEPTLIDAAMLAIYHSPARPASLLDDDGVRQVQADVTYALRKLVRKPRHARAGTVTVAGGKTLRVRLDPERLRRLLATHRDR